MGWRAVCAAERLVDFTTKDTKDTKGAQGAPYNRRERGDWLGAKRPFVFFVSFVVQNLRCGRVKRRLSGLARSLRVSP